MTAAEINETRVVESIKGAVIEGGALTDDGFHLELEDGRVVIFQGEFIIAVCRVSQHQLQ